MGEGLEVFVSNSFTHCSAQNVNIQPHVREVGNRHLYIVRGRKINYFSESGAKIIAIL